MATQMYAPACHDTIRTSTYLSSGKASRERRKGWPSCPPDRPWETALSKRAQLSAGWSQSQALGQGDRGEGGTQDKRMSLSPCPGATRAPGGLFLSVIT